jgi:hypothetical protein
MGSRKWIAAATLASATALAITWLLGVEDQPAAARELVASAPSVVKTDVELEQPFDTIEQGTRTESVRGGGEPGGAPAPQELDVIALFEELGLPGLYWQSFSTTAEFRELDLSPIRRLVREHGLEFDDLFDAFTHLDGAHDLRPTLLLACGFCDNVSHAQLDRLRDIGTFDFPDPNHSALGRLSAGSGYAAIHALSLVDAQVQLADISIRALPRFLDWQPNGPSPVPPQYVRDTAVLALDALAEAGPELQIEIRRGLAAEPEGLFTESIWRLHGRSVTGRAQAELLEQARTTHGYARLAIEDVDDEACVATLDDLVRTAPDSVPGRYLSESASIALLNIATPTAWRAFERVLLDATPRQAPWDALESTIEPQNLANLIECESRWIDAEVSTHARTAIRSSMARARGQLDRCNTPRRIVRQTCARMRAVVPDVAHDEVALSIALYVLAQHGDPEDHRFVRSWLGRLSESSARSIESLMPGQR